MRARMMLGVFVWLLAACGLANTTAFLAPPPNLYTFATGAAYPADTVPDRLQRTTTEILYVTDRNPQVGGDGVVNGYGSRRSDAMAFGVSLVEYGNLTDWNELVSITQSQRQRGITRLDSVYLEEFVRFPDTPLPFQSGSGRLQTTGEAYAAYSSARRQMQVEISKRLRTNGLDRVMVYVHGFNNDFDDAVGTLANIWHYSGRRSLPVLYSWPAGNDGPLAYFRDVEAGEFSVFHMKEFLRILSEIPELKRIDIVAHSRGSAVMSVALRELLIELRGAKRDPRTALKTGVLILAAPDLDIGVVRQRLVAERLAQAFDQVNIYTNPDDGALKLSRLVGRVTRLGGVDPAQLTAKERADLQSAENASIIIVQSGGTQVGHAYFRENPAVLSDIVLALRTRARPGTAFRPLEKVTGNIFMLHPNYPADPLPVMLDRPLPDR